MHDQPEPTPEEHEQVLERQQEEEAMRYPGHDDPQRLIDPKPEDREE